MELLIKSTMDQTMQPSLFFAAKGNNRPLLVGLHTWSYDRFNQEKKLLPIAQQYDYNLLLPEFRGVNKLKNPNRALACGSEYARQDIKDAIDYMIAEKNIDKENIFLFGESGGGHMALMMAAYCPNYFKAIAASVPISNLIQWAEEREEYRIDIFACCGEDPVEIAKRSPISYIEKIAKANLKIFHGKYDPVVPVKQSIALFNRITEVHPEARVYLDVFDGGHETDMITVFHWLQSQYNQDSKVAVTG